MEKWVDNGDHFHCCHVASISWDDIFSSRNSQYIATRN